MSDFTNAIYAIVRKCPRGKVVSYGAVAALAGRPRAARAVGTALGAMHDDLDIPWWRVINSAGSISHRPTLGGKIQRRLLEKEGVRFNKSNRVDWDKYGWSADDLQT